MCQSVPEPEPKPPITPEELNVKNILSTGNNVIWNMLLERFFLVLGLLDLVSDQLSNYHNI